MGFELADNVACLTTPNWRETKTLTCLTTVSSKVVRERETGFYEPHNFRPNCVSCEVVASDFLFIKKAEKITIETDSDVRNVSTLQLKYTI